MLKKIHIYDCDGVLVDSSHRTRFLDNGKLDLAHWLENDTEENINKDTLLPLSENYKRDLMCKKTYVIICTARELQAPDFRFIRDNLGYPNHFIYKSIFNRYIPDPHFKRRELKKLFNLVQFRHLIKRFWDDNIFNVYAVAELGVQSFHVQKDKTE
jgi:hypothetical protein